MILLVCRIFKNEKNGLIYKTETDSQRKQTYNYHMRKQYAINWEFGINIYVVVQSLSRA